MNLRTTTTAILQATEQREYAEARIKRLRARLQEEFHRRWREDGAAPSAKMKGLGQVRLDNTDPTPKPYVKDPEAFGSWVAEHHPTEALATLLLPPDRLDEVLAALDFAGIQHEGVTLGVRPGFVNALLPSLDIDVLPGETEGATETIAIHPDSGEVIPGVGATVPAPRLVVALDKTRKADLEARAELEAADEEAALVGEQVSA